MTKPPKFRSKTRLTGAYPQPALNFKGKDPEINNWIISEFVVKDLVPLVDIHPFPIPELHLLTAVTCIFKPDNVFEWGTNVGKSARIFYEISQKFGLGFEIFTIDLPDEANHPELPQKDQYAFYIQNLDAIHKIRGDGLTESLNIVKTLPGSARNLFFLDGDHSLHSVSRELDAIFATCSNPCVVVHDTFNQTSESGYNIGPHQAIQAFLKTHPTRQILMQTNYGLPGMTAII